ncbi:hypothetical protein FHT76_008044 [Rhizobium sp. BK176]|nr:ATP-binding protein [Rhizobium sp. BK176]MCS4096323.1 hypothetical protein [Rhizobium sp. BK176]
MRGVVRWAYGIGVTDLQAKALARSNWKRLKLAMTRGRPISRAFAIIEKMAREEPSASKQTKDPEALSQVRLEDMEGLRRSEGVGARSCARARRLARGDDLLGRRRQGNAAVGSARDGQDNVRPRARRLMPCQADRHFVRQAAGEGISQRLPEGHAEELQGKDAAPAILFIDEVDAFGSRDGAQGSNASYDIKAINGLLE